VLNFVRSHTSIPVPKLRRYITTESDYTGYMLLEKIKGKRLDRLWPSLSPLQKFLVAWTLRGYIIELREASDAYSRRNVPGPMGDRPRLCDGPAWLFGHRPLGPFKSSEDIAKYFNENRAGVGEGLDNSRPLVLTHCDRSMHNIIVGLDGKIWLVDWEWSGFYPPSFEHIAMMRAAENDGERAPKSWWDYIPLVTGAWVKEECMLGWPYGRPK
jgi:hypothetical protein